MKTVLVDLSALDTSLRLRGIGRHVQLLASGLSRIVQSDDCGLRIIGLVHLSPFANDNALHDLQHIEFDPMPPRASLLDDQKTQWFRRLILQRAAKNARADLIHLPDPNAPPLRFTRSPLQLVTCHDLATVRSNRPWLRFTTSVHKRLMAHRYLSADHIISISSYTAEDLRTLFGLPSSRISTVYNGIDSNRWSSEKNEEDARICQKYGISNTPFALYVGHASWRKNQSGMLRALRYARELKPDLGLQLVWAGRLSVDEFSAIDREARNLGIRHALRLLNFVSDEELACLYRCAAAHLLVSRHEGFGLTVVEAMACGCPVITTRRTALAEVAGDAALHVEPDDHEHIGKALLRLIEDHDLRRDIVARGIERAIQFSVERQARETLAVYQRVLGIRP